MIESAVSDRTLNRARLEKSYPSSIQKVARHLLYVEADARILDLADELQADREAAVVTVLGEGGKPLGIIPRDSLFALLGKPFGRDVLARSRARDLAEATRTFDADSELFGAAKEILDATDDRDESFFPLVDGKGRFGGAVSSRDLAGYLSRMTRDDIELASRLQDRLVAGNEMAGGPGWRFDAWSRPAKGVGGDMHFARPLPGGELFLAICDVSGKGVAASLIVSMVWGMLRMYDFRGGLRELVVRLNESVIATFQLEKYLTGLFMIYRPAERRLDCADMGHSHVVLLRERRALRPRGARTNLPVGIEADIDPAIHSLSLRQGDAFVAYSDGITEQENGQGEEFGEKRFIAAVAESLARRADPRQTASAAIDAFRGGTPQQDDMSFVILGL